MLRHHASGGPIWARLDSPRSAVVAVDMIGDAWDALVASQPVDERGRLEDGMMAATVTPGPNVEALSGHVAEGGGVVV